MGFLGVGEQTAGSADGQGQALAAEAFQVLGGELLAQALVSCVALEVPGGATAYGTSGDAGREGDVYTIGSVSVKVNLME